MREHDPEIEDLGAKVHCAVVLERTPPTWKLDRKESKKLSLKYRRGEGGILIVSPPESAWFADRNDAAAVTHVDIRGPAYKGSLTGGEISPPSAARGAGSSAPHRRRGVDRRPRRCRHRKCSGGYAPCRRGRRHGAGNDRRLDLRVYRNMPNIWPFLRMIVSGVGRLWATRQGSYMRRQDALRRRCREADTRGRWQHEWRSFSDCDDSCPMGYSASQALGTRG
jgi:hypothetical protein